MRNLVNVRKEVRKFLLEADVTVPQPNKGKSPFTGWTISREDARKIFEKLKQNAGADTSLAGIAGRALLKFDKIPDENLARGVDLAVNRFISNSIASGSKYKDAASLVATAGSDKNSAGMLKIIDAAIDSGAKTPKASPIPGFTGDSGSSGDAQSDLSSALSQAAMLGASAASGAVSTEIANIAANATRIKNNFTTEVSIGPSTDSIETLARAIVSAWQSPALNTSGDTLSDSAKSCVTLIRVTNLLLEKRNDKEILAAVVGAGVPLLALLSGPAVTKALSSKYFETYVTRRGAQIQGGSDYLTRLTTRKSDIISKEMPEIKKMVDDLRKVTNTSAIDAEIAELEKAVTTMEGLLTAPTPSTGIRGGSGGKPTSDARKAIADNITSLRKSIGTLSASKQIEPSDLASYKALLDRLQKRQGKLLDEFFSISDLLAKPEYIAGLDAAQRGVIGLYATRFGQGSPIAVGGAILWWSSFAKGFDNFMSRLPPATSTAVNLMGFSEITISDGGVSYDAPADSGELYSEISGNIDTMNLIASVQEINTSLTDEEAGQVADDLTGFVLSCLTAPASEDELSRQISSIALIASPKSGK